MGYCGHWILGNLLIHITYYILLWHLWNWISRHVLGASNWLFNTAIFGHYQSAYVYIHNNSIKLGTYHLNSQLWWYCCCNTPLQANFVWYPECLPECDKWMLTDHVTGHVTPILAKLWGVCMAYEECVCLMRRMCMAYEECVCLMRSVHGCSLIMWQIMWPRGCTLLIHWLVMGDMHQSLFWCDVFGLYNQVCPRLQM